MIDSREQLMRGHFLSIAAAALTAVVLGVGLETAATSSQQPKAAAASIN